LFFNFLIHLGISSFEIFMFMFSFSSFTSPGSNVMDKAILAHRRKLSREINNLKSSNSQELWKLLKKGKKSSKFSLVLLFLNILLRFLKFLLSK
jgi:hypothetical protein